MFKERLKIFLFGTDFDIEYKKNNIMKRLTTLFAFCTIILTSSCTGPAGPPGYDNIGKVFEASKTFPILSYPGGPAGPVQEEVRMIVQNANSVVNLFMILFFLYSISKSVPNKNIFNLSLNINLIDT